ncbi:alcohol dehydrogenase [Leptospira ryugenii]|uniref:Alcohol dehydrogenase n=1 Tax=Leptospira ryugenii TaxID=1917863 RepID=A0A2P2DV58_9LEPT|nr:zinc-binding alcohol dehydrogenase family protein [Leptospira ryugenii]GBF48528.1 alcohol dehydrogenase [Leptospira ryugenii]
MKAIQIFEHGSADQLTVTELVTPKLKEGEVLIKVEAISINHFDILSRKGIYPKMQLPRTLGMDCAGVVISSTDLQGRWKGGERVLVLGETLGLGGPGAYSEYVNVPANEVFSIPDFLSMEEAASIGISCLTALYVTKYKLSDMKGRSVLIPGISGGVASSLLQFCKLFGAKTIVTSRSESHCVSAIGMGANYAIKSNDPNALKQIQEQTDGKGVDIVLNAVGGPSIPFSIQSLVQKGGQLYLIGTCAGKDVELNLFQILIKEINLIGCNFGSLLPEERGNIYQEFLEYLRQNQFHIQIDRIFPLTEAKEAHQYIESGGHSGKVILKP